LKYKITGIKKMSKDKNILVKYGLPAGLLVLAFIAPATTIGAAIGGAIGLGGGVAYNAKKSNGASGGVVVAATTAIGLAAGGLVGLSSDFNSAGAMTPPDTGITINAESAMTRTLDDILDGGIKNAQGKPVYLKLES
tara:strand:- start:69943 stop:70353 length:411 start_codon:yes stop_codon:yes gene_type:complete